MIHTKNNFSLQLKLLSIHTERLAADFKLLEAEMPLENLEIMLSTRLKHTEARFLIKIKFDLLHHDIQQYSEEWDVLLLFDFCGTSFSRVAPELYLSTALNNLLDGIGSENIPLFQADQRITDYVLHVKNCISEKVD